MLHDVYYAIAGKGVIELSDADRAVLEKRARAYTAQFGPARRSGSGAPEILGRTLPANGTGVWVRCWQTSASPPAVREVGLIERPAGLVGHIAEEMCARSANRKAEYVDLADERT